MENQVVLTAQRQGQTLNPRVDLLGQTQTVQKLMDVPSFGIRFPSAIAMTRSQAEEMLTTACSARLHQEINVHSQQKKKKCISMKKKTTSNIHSHVWQEFGDNFNGETSVLLKDTVRSVLHWQVTDVELHGASWT